MRQLLTPDQVAGLLQVHVKTVYQWAADGKLPAIRLGNGIRKMVRFDPDVLESYMKTPMDGKALFDNEEDNNNVRQTDRARQAQSNIMVDRERTAEKARTYGLRLVERRKKV
jgi:excisionase family DNA binding protein